MRTRLDPCILVLLGLAALARAADPTSRPSVMTELPLPEGAIDARIGLLLGDGQIVRVVRRMPPPLPGMPDGGASAISICNSDGKDAREFIVPDIAVRGVASAGPDRIFIWGTRRGDPTQPRQDAVAVWNIRNIRQSVRFDTADSFFIQAVAMATKAPRALVSLDGGRVRWFNSDTGRELRTVNVGRTIGPVALSADGQRAALGGGVDDEVLHVWDLAADRELARGVGHHGPITSVSFSKDERTILTSSVDGSTRVWDAATGRELRRLRPAGVPVVSAVFSPDEGRVLTTLGIALTDRVAGTVRPDNQLRLWDVSTAKILMRYDTADSEVAAARFSADGDEILGLVGNELWTWTAPQAGTTQPTSRPATRPATAPSSNDIELPAGSQSFSLGDNRPSATRESSPIHRVGFFSDGRAFSASPDGPICIWDLATRTLRATHVPAPGRNYSQVADVSRDGRHVVGMSAGGGQQLVVWDLGSGLASVDTQLQVPSLISAVLSPDGTLAAVLHLVDNAGHTLVTFYRTNDGSVAGTIDPQGNDARSIALSPDGNRLAVRTNDPRVAVKEFDLDTGKRIATYAINDNDLLDGMSYSADGSRLAGVAQHAAYVWETKTSRRIVRMMYKSTLLSVALSPDGGKLITGGADSNVRVIDLASNKPIGRFDDPRRPVTSLAASPDGQWIVAGSGEPTFWVFRMP